MAQAPRVLLVDDESDIRTIASMTLSKIGKLDVRTAESGAEAIALAVSQPPDILMLDVMMPGLDGPTTLARMRAAGLPGSTIVIFMTAKMQRAELDTYLALGAAGVITKPFDPLTLPAEVARIVEAHRR